MNIPSELMRLTNSYAINSLSTDEELYYEAKRINSNFSLQMEYHRYLLETAKETRYIEENILDIYNRLSHILYSLQFISDEEGINVITNKSNVGKFKEIFGDDFDEKHMTLRSDSPGFYLYYHIKHNSRGYIYSRYGTSIEFDLNVPEGYYNEVFSQELANAMKEEGMKLYEIVQKQQDYYNMTRILSDEVRQYLDENRRQIRNVKYDFKKGIIIDPMDIILGTSLEEFKGIVAYLNHPGNIVYENRDIIHPDFATRYFTLDTI